jgi:nucleotide-binding universal stress UspA family protein
MSAISTTHHLSITDDMSINFRVKNAKSVASGIVDEAGTGKYDLILLSNSTYRKRLKCIFGNKMDEVIRNANIETTVLRYRDDLPVSYKKILIPTSGYHHTARAARLAEIMSRKYDSDITVLYVGESHEDASVALRPVIDVLSASGVQHRALFRKGPVVETILDEADRGYDLMMIGATEGPKVPNYLLGSIADKLVTKSPCPVLMVKSLNNK